MDVSYPVGGLFRTLRKAVSTVSRVNHQHDDPETKDW